MSDEVIMFIPCFERQGTAYFEFQYCKNKWTIKKVLKKGYSFWEKDSLLVHVDHERIFFENYGGYLETPDSLDGTRKLDPYGVNYYTQEQASVILEQIKNDKPQEFEALIPWLEKAATEHNGFFFLGI